VPWPWKGAALSSDGYPVRGTPQVLLPQAERRSVEAAREAGPAGSRLADGGAEQLEVTSEAPEALSFPPPPLSLPWTASAPIGQ